MRFIILLCITVFFTVNCCDNIRDCYTEEDALSYVNQLTDNFKDLSISLIKTSIEHSWWKVASKVINRCHKDEIDIKNIFDEVIREKNIQIRKLQSFYNAHKNEFAIIAPAYQWAEGLLEVDLNIKLAHKWDAPATLGCDDISLNFTDSMLLLEANCPSTSKTFVLKLQLHDQIVPENCTWSRAAVSRIVVTLVKKERGLWGDLLGLGLSTPRNAHTWYSMRDQLDKKDKEMLEAENVAKRLEERRISKERREREYALMEERKRKKKASSIELYSCLLKFP